MNHAYEELKPYLERVLAFQTAKILFEWDNETLAPKEAERNHQGGGNSVRRIFFRDHG